MRAYIGFYIIFFVLDFGIWWLGGSELESKDIVKGALITQVVFTLLWFGVWLMCDGW